MSQALVPEAKALILDTEGTGLDEPDVIQLAHKGPLTFGAVDALSAEALHFRPRPHKPITIGAMATHRIILDDLDGYPVWPGSWQVPEGVGYLIGHSIDFDWKAIGAPVNVKRIDTMALAKRVWPDLDSYKLAALIFHLVDAKSAREMTVNAHNASQDIYLTEFLLDNLLTDIRVAGTYEEVACWEQLWTLSETARIPLRIGFSKFGPKNGKPGTLYSEVPAGMLRWIIDPQRVNDMDPWEVKAAKRQLGIE